MFFLKQSNISYKVSDERWLLGCTLNLANKVDFEVVICCYILRVCQNYIKCLFTWRSKSLYLLDCVANVVKSKVDLVKKYLDRNCGVVVVYWFRNLKCPQRIIWIFRTLVYCLTAQRGIEVGASHCCRYFVSLWRDKSW